MRRFLRIVSMTGRHAGAAHFSLAAWLWFETYEPPCGDGGETVRDPSREAASGPEAWLAMVLPNLTKLN